MWPPTASLERCPPEDCATSIPEGCTGLISVSLCCVGRRLRTRQARA